MGDVVRIFGGRGDPLERGPAKRVSHVVENIGEHVAASKKRASWKFTLGESDTIHEVTLFHSVVHFDGREQYMNNHMVPGDWSVVLLLESSNSAVEVHINDIEAGDIPKYDLVIDRVPYRRMDVYRRSKAKPSPHVFASTNSYGHLPDQSQVTSHHDAGLQKGHWGPSGMTAESASNRTPPPAKATPPSKSQPQAQATTEVNLLDTSAPEVSVSAHAIVFDPFVTGAPAPKSTGQPAPSSSVDLMGLFSQAPPVQPSTGSAQPGSTNFATAPMNRAPSMRQPGFPGPQPGFQAGFPMQQPGYQGFPPTMPGGLQQPPMGTGFGQSMATFGAPVQQQGFAAPTYPPQQTQSAFAFMQGPPSTGGYNPPPAANYAPAPPNLSISSLMDPHHVNTAHASGRQQQSGQGININAFANMS
ncbi:hypothetical protein ACHHYP_16113 [Achlya hypogyna]|uniref:Uncharacterized protein n=1 Tax=Achlya hypogyna TaxID=1202772 RepID=A0A1V9ZE96_ACHHY|nr:hypothetical protein ACHHYP_16113 [Achlya hypogyna]